MARVNRRFAEAQASATASAKEERSAGSGHAAERPNGYQVIALGNRDGQAGILRAGFADPGVRGTHRLAAGAPLHRSATTTC